MKASEIILDSFIFQNTNRGQATDLLCDLVLLHYGNNMDRLSNGEVIDSILRLMDKLIEDDHDAEMGLIASIELLEHDTGE